MTKLFDGQINNAVSTDFIQWEFAAATIIVNGDLDGGTVAIQVCDTEDGTYQDITDFTFTAAGVKHLPQLGYGLFVKAEFRSSAEGGTGVTVIVAPCATELKAKKHEYTASFI